MRPESSLAVSFVGPFAIGGELYPILPLLATERVRRTTQLSKDLDLDLQTAEVSIETG